MCFAGKWFFLYIYASALLGLCSNKYVRSFVWGEKKKRVMGSILYALVKREWKEFEQKSEWRKAESHRMTLAKKMPQEEQEHVSEAGVSWLCFWCQCVSPRTDANSFVRWTRKVTWTSVSLGRKEERQQKCEQVSISHLYKRWNQCLADVAQGPAALAPPGSLLEMRILGPHPLLKQSEIVRQL